MARIALVEDDEVIREGLKENLAKLGHQVSVCSTIADFEKLDVASIDLIIMDWELPDGEGLDAIKKLRLARDLTPVIMLTARTDVIDKVLGLELGANDYMTKPFELRELVARIKIQLKEDRVQTKLLAMGEISVDIAAKQASFKGAILQLTKMEYQLLVFFMENAGRALARDEILNAVWGLDNYPTTRTIDAHVTSLRQKVCPQYFETLRGIGYRFKAGG